VTLKLGVPSKGRLMEDTFAWFGARGVTLERTGSDREYAGAVSGVEGVELILMSAGEIPRELAAGRIDLGVTGTDLVREKIALWADKIDPLAELGFGHADLILAVPRFWADVSGLDDLDAVGVADYQLVDSQGATEGTVKNETAEAIADITSSGATLEANHLKVLAGPPILRSQATLFASKTSGADAGLMAELSAKLGL
jgi:ATP phosphoribosyltransferase